MSPNAAVEFSTCIGCLAGFARSKTDAVRTRFKKSLELGVVKTVDICFCVDPTEGLLTGIHQEYDLFAIGFSELREKPIESNGRMVEVMAIAVGASQIVNRISRKGMTCIINEQNVVVQAGLNCSANPGFDGSFGRLLIDE